MSGRKGERPTIRTSVELLHVPEFGSGHPSLLRITRRRRRPIQGRSELKRRCPTFQRPQLQSVPARLKGLEAPSDSRKAHDRRLQRVHRPLFAFKPDLLRQFRRRWAIGFRSMTSQKVGVRVLRCPLSLLACATEASRILPLDHIAQAVADYAPQFEIRNTAALDSLIL